jgi:hypothetical protein
MRPHTSLVPQRPTRNASSCTIEDAIATALERVPLRSSPMMVNPGVLEHETLIALNQLKLARDSDGDVGTQDRMRFPALPLREAIGRFTQAAYGQKLDFEHA